MKNKRSITFLFLFCLTIMAFAQDLTFATVENQSLMEICSRILVEIYGRLDMEISIIPMSALRAHNQAMNGSVDGEVARIETYGENSPQLIRIPSPLYRNDTSAFVRIDSLIDNLTKADLERYKVARIKGVINTDKLTENVTSVYEFDNIASMMDFVAKGRADIALTSKVGGLTSLLQTGNNDIVALSPPIISRNMYHFLHESHEDLVPLIDRTIREMIYSGEMEELIHEIESNLLSIE